MHKMPPPEKSGTKLHVHIDDKMLKYKNTELYCNGNLTHYVDHPTHAFKDILFVYSIDR